MLSQGAEGEEEFDGLFVEFGFCLGLGVLGVLVRREEKGLRMRREEGLLEGEKKRGEEKGRESAHIGRVDN